MNAEFEDPLPEPKCQVCGCTEGKACVTSDGPCSWVAPGVLCSACLPKVKLPAPGDAISLAACVRPLTQQPPIGLVLDAVDGMQLLSLLQLVWRHPQLPPNMRAFAEAFGGQLQQWLSVTPELAAITALGWNPACDEPTESRIILPGQG